MPPDTRDPIWPNDEEPWEPRSPEEWSGKDTLWRALDHERHRSNASLLFGAWRRLPSELRRQAWREREIATVLFRERSIWREVPGAFTVGVGLREVGGRRQLAAVVSLETVPVRFADELFEAYQVPRELGISSITPFEKTVPVVFEASAAPIQHGIVPADQFILTSAAPVPVSTPTLQSGDEVAGQRPAGFRVPGTLTAIVSEQAKFDPLLLSAAHVFGDAGQDVLGYAPNPAVIATVTRLDTGIDAALAEPRVPWSIDYRCKGVNMVPAQPVTPYSDMAVQLYGAMSRRHQLGFVDKAYAFPVGGSAAGVVPHFTVDIVCTGGDSGALLLSGHGAAPPVPAAHATHMHSAYLESLTCAMLGMLVAGPSAQASSVTRPLAYFLPIVEILDRLKIEPWCRDF